MTTPLTSALPGVLERQFLEGIQFALEELSRSLVSKVTQLVQEQISSTRGPASKSRQALVEAVASQMPGMLEQAFIARLLSNEASARQHRAVLAHLLSAAEVQAVAGHTFAPLPLATSGPAPVLAEAEEITSEAAAKLLHVSRTHLNALADSGALGPVRRTEGGHRRLVKAQVMRYLRDTQDRQVQGVQDMMSATEALGLYEDEAQALRPKRSRRP